MTIDVIARLREIAPMHGGACMNELRQLISELQTEANKPATPATPTAPAEPKPPVVVDVPYASQAGDQLTCTMGNWEDPAPDSYDYQWQRGSVNILGAGAADYTVTARDVGQSLACVVTASHAGGSTSSTSNAVIVTDPVKAAPKK